MGFRGWGLRFGSEVVGQSWVVGSGGKGLVGA